jgi:hypothetical protein
MCLIGNFQDYFDANYNTFITDARLSKGLLVPTSFTQSFSRSGSPSPSKPTEGHGLANYKLSPVADRIASERVASDRSSKSLSVNIGNAFRQLVSKKKKRFKEEGFVSGSMPILIDIFIFGGARSVIW